MSTNVVDINSRRRGSYQTASIDQLQQDVKAELQAQNNADGPDAAHSIIVQDLHALADDMMIRKLALVHQQEADRRSWATQEQEMAAELEAAAFLAFRSGVPEEAIYDIDYTPLSDALTSAIRKVGQL
jgi:hypothetical protein